jgi:hypothetical protein
MQVVYETLPYKNMGFSLYLCWFLWIGLNVLVSFFIEISKQKKSSLTHPNLSAEMSKIQIKFHILVCIATYTTSLHILSMVQTESQSKNASLIIKFQSFRPPCSFVQLFKKFNFKIAKNIRNIYRSLKQFQ